MTFCAELKSGSAGIWQQEAQHPFVLGLGDGSLSPEKFRHYLVQDYLFLMDYARVFAFASAKSPDLAMQQEFAQLCAATLGVEMEHHRQQCAAFGLSPAELETAQPSQVTSGYAGHLLNVAATGTMTEIIAAVLPCQWGYAELAQALSDRGLPGEPRYRKWIEMYTAPEFIAYGDRLRTRLDTQAEYLSASEKSRLKSHFLTSSRWEYLFWEMAWQEEGWSVPGESRLSL